MRRIIGRTNAASRFTGGWWLVFAAGTLLGVCIVFTQMAIKELSLKRDSINSVHNPLNNDLATEEAPAKGLWQAPLLTNPEELPERPSQPQSEPVSKWSKLYVGVYVTKDKRIERVPLEMYVRGVVAAEMPADFELEALKAQAIAARTYIIRRIELGDRSGMPEEAAHADVTDTQEHQVYVPLTGLVNIWPKNKRAANLSKLTEAVKETEGQLITYKGEPIQAVFFSTSNGYTENSEDYWQQEIPYLRSVASPWDEAISPRYKETVKLSLSTFYAKLGMKQGTDKPAINIVKRTEGNRIDTISIGGTTFTGREVREKLALASSQFTWKIKGSTISITTYGYGHGVGMSQWGANGMAEEGATAEKILAHYYSGTQIQQASKLSSAL